MQEKLILLGCNNIYHEVPKLIEQLLGIKISETQVYRSCQAMSLIIPDELASCPSDSLREIEETVEETVYGMVDGSMLFTDDGWQETKLGRVFKAALQENTSGLSWKVSHSEYVAQRGHCSHFLPDFERLLSPSSICKKVFITDGAPWIGIWLKETYPDSIHILDYFHVCEHLGDAASASSDPIEWLAIQKERVLSEQLPLVIHAIKLLDKLCPEKKASLIQYIENNIYRMKYREYRKQGLMISSGAIESAHRTVLQIRMKRSGQRWSNLGGDNMIKLRVMYKSNKFNLITSTLKSLVA